MDDGKKLKGGIKRIVLQELRDLGFQDLVREVVKEEVAGMIRATLRELSEESGSDEPASIGMPMFHEPHDGAANPNRSVASLDREIPSFQEIESTGAGDAAALYLYGVAQGREEARFGPVGIEDGEVYTIVHDDLIAIVHDCAPEPYQSQEQELVKQWLFTHQKVLDLAYHQYGTVLPMGFNTIFRPQGEPVVQAVKHWLEEESARLHQIFHRVQGKDEYGVQVFLNQEILKQSILDQNAGIQKIKQEMEAKPEGVRYMYQQKIERAVKEAWEEKGEACFHEAYQVVSSVSDSVKVEKTKKAENGLCMVVNLSCLVAKEKVEELGRILAEIDDREGSQVRFTGPWPPYSFMDSFSMGNEESMSA
ncbi:GvpL/GvpF family gas vesicle protein [Candidatus Formimonas warabiya]|uniref:GvpL/GvpF family gas vesicle protein n=1 Tax=Formimonas warabiya TaxID=1761012 RepID=A0A3G1KW47_FORW1|nr:GvpL/GvpF family gas vesicle protein [Candidatus Formimonas warabiya]ATW26435.1 hypothetical protein DCMF_18270 [Candidatus Formimonas warabiya]